jgi:hypothetical protein
MNFSPNCMPGSGGDIVSGFFTASYDNSAGSAPATATIVSAKLLVMNDMVAGEWSFEADPPSSGSIAAGATESMSHDKLADSLMGTLDPCDFCTRSSSWSLQVTWDVNGTTVIDTLDPVGTQCVF